MKFSELKNVIENSYLYAFSFCNIPQAAKDGGMLENCDYDGDSQYLCFVEDCEIQSFSLKMDLTVGFDIVLRTYK